jgi:cytoskeleton protein RodZ
MPREAASAQPAASAALAQGAAPGAPATEASKTPAAAQPASAAQSSLAAQSPESAVAAGGSTVAFTVTQDSWFSVRDKSGKELFSGIVHAGDTKELQGEQPFKVVAGNRAGLQSVTFDGKTVDASKYAAAKGNVSRFSLP